MESFTIEEGRIHQYVPVKGGRGGPRPGRHSAGCWCGEGDYTPKPSKPARTSNGAKSPSDSETRRRIVAYIRRQGIDGATAPEVVKQLGTPKNGTSARIKEAADAGELVKNGEVRYSSRISSAVYVAPEFKSPDISDYDNESRQPLPPPELPVAPKPRKKEPSAAKHPLQPISAPAQPQHEPPAEPHHVHVPVRMCSTCHAVLEE